MLSKIELVLSKWIENLRNAKGCLKYFIWTILMALIFWGVLSYDALPKTYSGTQVSVELKNEQYVKVIGTAPVLIRAESEWYFRLKQTGFPQLWGEPVSTEESADFFSDDDFVLSTTLPPGEWGVREGHYINLTLSSDLPFQVEIGGIYNYGEHGMLIMVISFVAWVLGLLFLMPPGPPDVLAEDSVY